MLRPTHTHTHTHTLCHTCVSNTSRAIFSFEPGRVTTKCLLHIQMPCRRNTPMHPSTQSAARRATNHEVAYRGHPIVP